MEKDSKSEFMEKYLTPIAVLLGAAIIAVALIFGSGGKPASDGKVAPKVNIKDVSTEGAPFIGNANAPVVMAFWFDYQCPFCKQFEQNVGSQLNENYVKTGKLKIVFKDFQFLGEDSTVGGEFGRAMWEAYPDHYYEWLQAMFAAQDDEGDKGFGDLESIKGITAKISGVDVAKVVALMNQKKSTYDAMMAADRAEAQKFGVNGTPSFIVGTTMTVGSTYEAAAKLIDEQLKK